MRSRALLSFLLAACSSLIFLSCAPGSGAYSSQEDTGEGRQQTEPTALEGSASRSTTEDAAGGETGEARLVTVEKDGSSRTEQALNGQKKEQERSQEHGQNHKSGGERGARKKPFRQPERRAAEIGDPSSRPRGSCAHPLVLVDRQYGLSPAYSPRDLVYLSTYGVPLAGGNGLLRQGAAASLARLVAAASASGEEIVVASAYRSYYDQQSSYANWTSYYGSGAGGVSAPPGHSEHQLGTAVDFTNSAAGYQIGQTFGETTAAWWLAANAHRYGFVMSYPANKETVTGYAWEPWHYRYIGVGNARRLHGSGLSLREFLLRRGVRPACS